MKQMSFLLLVTCLFACLFASTLSVHAQDLTGSISYQTADGSFIELQAGADTDGDRIENGLEIDGFVFDLFSGEIQAWDGDPSKEHFFTDPLRASTDGDPYSDLMEVTGANMPGSIEAPFNHPLVAARPIIAVYMTDYEVIPNGQITDEEGGSVTDSFTNETKNEDTFGVGISTEFELNPFSLASVSVEANYSHTHSFTQSSTFTEEFNWSSARSVSESEAARLRLNVYYVNLGSAPASNVRPTFNLMLGNKVIATFQSSLNSEAQTLAPGARFPANGSIAIDSYVAGEVDRDIILSLEELKAVQRGTPLSIVVPQVEANILRWNEATQSFSNQITWADYEQDIDPVSITLETNIGGESVQYQVYTGSPQFADPLRNLRETLELLFEVEDRNGTTFIADRRFPEEWYFATDSEEIIDAKDALGENGSMLDVPMFRGNRLVMLSPGFDAAPKVDHTTFSKNLEYVFASARPIDGFPITHAVATLYQETRLREVPLEPIPGSPFVVNTAPIEELYYGGFVTVYNARGDARVEELVSPGLITDYQACNVNAGREFGDYGLPLSGDLGNLFRVNCRFVGDLIVHEQPWTEVAEANQGTRFTWDVYVVSRNVALRATQTGGANALMRSIDGGQTWGAPGTFPSGERVNAFYFLDDQRGFAIGGGGRIWKSEDAGDTWVRVPQSFTESSLLGIDFYDENNGLIVGGNGAALKTTDGGDSWVPLTISAPGTDVADYGKLGLNDVQFINFERIAVTSFNAILMSYDGGDQWEVHRVSDIFEAEVCCVSAKDVQFPTASTGYFVGSFSPRLLFKTEDGGRTWEKLSIPNDASVNKIHFFDARNGIAVGQDLLHTTDGGVTWVEQKATTIPDVNYNGVHFRNGLGILTGQKDQTSYVFHTTPASTDFTLGPEGRAVSVKPENVLRYDGDPLTINGATSLDEAVDVFKAYDYVIFGDPTRWVDNPPIIYDLQNHPEITNTRFFVGVDVGVTTSNLQGTDLALAIIVWDNVFLTNFGSEYGVTRERQNEALHWVNEDLVTVILDAPAEELFLDTVDADFNPTGAALDINETAYYFYDDYLIEDGGYADQTTWQQKSAIVKEASKEIGFRVLATTTSDNSYDQDQFYYAWHGTLIDGWRAIGWGEPGYGVNNNQAPFRSRPDVVPGRTYFSDVSLDGALVHRQTENGEVAINFNTREYSFGVSVPVGIDDVDDVELPQNLTLLQNYPNPFTNVTTIPFELAQPGPVRLEVFDLLGRRVATYVNSVQPAGKHTVQVDASQLASGMYLYRIEAGGKSDTKRMVRVR